MQEVYGECCGDQHLSEKGGESRGRQAKWASMGSPQKPQPATQGAVLTCDYRPDLYARHPLVMGCKAALEGSLGDTAQPA